MTVDREDATTGSRIPTRDRGPVALGVVPVEGQDPDRWLPRVLALMLVGMIVTAVWMTWTSFEKRVEPMTDTAQWVTWVVVLAIQVGIFLAAAPALWIEARRSTQRFRGTPLVTTYIIGAFLVLPIGLTLLLFDRSHDVQEELGPRLLPIVVLGTLVAGLAATGLIRTHKDIEVAAPTADADADRSRFLELRRRVRLLGGVLALLVALAVLGAGAQRNAVVAMETAIAAAETVEAETVDPDADGTAKAAHTKAAGEATARAARFGIDIVWSYGLYYSFVLVLVYLPPYLSLIALGRRIRDQHAPRPLPGAPDYEVRSKVREAWDEELQLKTTTAESLRAATLILVPLLSSLASMLLGDVKVGE